MIQQLEYFIYMIQQLEYFIYPMYEYEKIGGFKTVLLSLLNHIFSGSRQVIIGTGS